MAYDSKYSFFPVKGKIVCIMENCSAKPCCLFTGECRPIQLWIGKWRLQYSSSWIQDFFIYFFQIIKKGIDLDCICFKAAHWARLIVHNRICGWKVVYLYNRNCVRRVKRIGWARSNIHIPFYQTDFGAPNRLAMNPGPNLTKTIVSIIKRPEFTK